MKIMKLSSKLIKNLDCYGKGVTLNINGKESIQSICSGFFSILNIILYLIILSVNFYEFIYHRSLSITTSEIFRPLEEIDTITDKNFMISHFFFSDNVIERPTLISMLPYYSNAQEFNLQFKNGKTNTKITQFGQLSDCMENNLYMDNKNFRSIYNKTQIFGSDKFFSCFNFRNKNNFSVGGDIISASQKIVISVETSYDLCKILNKASGCSTTYGELKGLKGTKLITIMKNNYIDKDKEEGYNEVFQSIQSEIDFTNDFEITLKARRVNITTDNNLIYNLMSNVETETFVYSYETNMVPRKGNMTTFRLQHNIILDSYTNVIERSYLKLDGMLANVGSIVVIIEFLTKFLADFFTEGNMEHSIYKEIYHINKKKSHDADPKILAEIRKFKEKAFKTTKLIIENNHGDYQNQINENQNLHSFKKQEEIELRDLDEGLNQKESFTKNSHNINNEKYRSPDDSVIGNSTSRSGLNEKIMLKNEPVSKPSNAHINININDQSTKKQDEKVYKEFRKILKEKTIKKTFLITFHKWFFPCLIKKNKNLRLLINLQDFINEELDIVKILKKLIEYEHFKGLFLTENQLKIFNLMQKRILTEEKLEEDASDYYIDFYFKNKMKELKTFKHLVDHLINVDEENQYSKPILEKIISSFSF